MPPKPRGSRTTNTSTVAHRTLPSDTGTYDSNNPKTVMPRPTSTEPEVPLPKASFKAAVSRAPSPMNNDKSKFAQLELKSPEPELEEGSKANQLKPPKSPKWTAEEPSSHAPASDPPEMGVSDPSASSESTISAPATAKKSKGTLADTMDECRARGKALREQLAQNPIVDCRSVSPAPSPTLDQSLIVKSGYTGILLIDRVIDDIKNSRYCLWLGDPKKILKNCEWTKDAASNTQTLMWKKNSLLKPAGGDGSALIGWMGLVSGELSNLSPDAGWTYPKPDYDSTYPNKKRNVALVNPEGESRFPRHIWSEQIKGYNALVEHTRRNDSAKSPTAIGYSFYDLVHLCLRVRSPLFLPPSTTISDSEDEDASDKDEDTDSDKGKDNDDDDDYEIPQSHHHSTWSISLPRVRDLLENLVEQGYKPQILNACDRFNKLVHPNQVHSTLNGTIAYVYATLERQLFTNSKIPGGKAWHFYANLVKVQALKGPSLPPKPNTLKRKDVHSYSMIDAYSKIAGSSSKHPKL